MVYSCTVAITCALGSVYLYIHTLLAFSDMMRKHFDTTEHVPISGTIIYDGNLVLYAAGAISLVS